LITGRVEVPVRRTLIVALAVAAAVIALTGLSAAGAAAPRPSVSSITVHSGPTSGGTAVTVHGHHFTHVRSVVFGSVRGARVHVVSSTKLTVRSPRHLPGGIDLRVVTKSGTSSVNGHDRYEFRTYNRIAAGELFSCRVASGGHVHCWGDNLHGELGDGTKNERHGTVTVTGLRGVVALGAGAAHSCALKADGTVWCWGSNGYGQLGDGTKGNERPAPVRVGGLSHVVAIGVGVYQSCAVVADGTARCWGDDTHGALGNGHNVVSPRPVVVSHLRHVVAIVASYQFGCARLAAGSVWCWGSNGDGQLGNHSTDPDSLVPVPVHGLHGVTDVALGYFHACAVSGGLVHCWGRNARGDLGDGSTVPSSLPTTVSGLSGVSSIAADNDDVCALVRGAVFCWGDDSVSQIGNGSPAVDTPELTPSAVVGLRGVTDLAVGGYHVLVRLADGSLRSWGFNRVWQLGSGTADDSPRPVRTTG